MKKAIPVFLFLVLALSVFSPLSAQAAIFPDVPNGFWAQKDIEEIAAKGIVTGKPNGRFDPNAPVTRGQFAQMLYRALHLPEGPASFKDIKNDTILGKAVGAIVQAKIAQGYPDGTFRPNQPITRGQMAVMITRALGYEDKAIAYKNAPLPFKDRFVETQRGYIKVVSELGIIRGTSATTFSAGKPTTRAQTAVILNRMLNYAQANQPISTQPINNQPIAHSVIAHTIPNLSKGLVNWESGTYYANPLGNGRWIIWIQEEKNFDRSLPKPDARRESDIRQAVFGWYDLETGRVQTIKLDYLYDSHPTLSPPALGIYKDVALVELGLDSSGLEPHLVLVDLKTGKTERLNGFYSFNTGHFLNIIDNYLDMVDGKYRNIDDRSTLTIDGFDLHASKNWLAWYRPNPGLGMAELMIQKRNDPNAKPQVLDRVDAVRDFNMNDKWLVYPNRQGDDQYVSLIAYNLETGEKTIYPGLFSNTRTIIDDYLIIMDIYDGFQIYKLPTNKPIYIHQAPGCLGCWNTLTSDTGQPYLFWYRENTIYLYDLKSGSLMRYTLPFNVSTTSEQMQPVSLTSIYKQHAYGWANSHILKIPLSEFKPVQ